MEHALRPVEIRDELAEPSRGEKLLVTQLVASLVGQANGNAAVEIRQLAEPLFEDVMIEHDRAGENLGVGEERDLRPRLLRQPRLDDWPAGDAAVVILLPDLAVAMDLGLEPFGESVHDRDADAVESTRDFIGVVVEFAPGVDLRQNDFEGAFAAFGVRVNRNAAAVVNDRDRTVGMDRHMNMLGVTGHRLVDRVVDDFVNQVVKPARRRVANVHARALADGVDAFENPDVRAGIRAVAAAPSVTIGVDIGLSFRLGFQFRRGALVLGGQIHCGVSSIPNSLRIRRRAGSSEACEPPAWLRQRVDSNPIRPSKPDSILGGVPIENETGSNQLARWSREVSIRRDNDSLP